MIPVSLFYASGATAASLSRWFSQAMEVSGIHITVMGDDNLFILNIPWRGPPIAVESDAKAYDQSQSIGPLRSEYKDLHDLGVPTEVTDLLYKVASGRWIFRWRHRTPTVINCSRRPQRSTGGPDTTLGNSINMGNACLFAVHDLSWLDDLYSGDATSFDGRFAALGFSMTTAVSLEPCRATFLRGWFKPSNDPAFPYIWVPLPSRILKVGKTKTHPRYLFSGPGVHALPKGPMRDAVCCAFYLAEQAKQLRSYSLGPLLAAFANSESATGSSPPPDTVQLTPRARMGLWKGGRWMPPGFPSPPPEVADPAAYAADVEARYGIGPREWEELKTQVSLMTPGVLMSNPAFELLAADYW